MGEMKKRSKEVAKENLSFNWANVVAGNAHKNDKAAAMMTTVATELRRKKERAQNVIAAIPVSMFKENEEMILAKKLALAIGAAEAKVKKARCITKKTPVRSETAETAGSNIERVLFVVEMDSVSSKLDMLGNSKKLRNSEELKGVYINEDLTPSERIAHKKLREEQDRRNNERTATATVNGRIVKMKECDDKKKRFWGIRNGELRLIVSVRDNV
ncbi:hypothetical protein BpHYR1_021774 [Brachionus plicatilis]|uniref:Uncharacterized protein n=1 Tax=Brachionus plicatilis TaxID=10195 RepID=A0A3M7SX16_BRAPC|nr:hypothetical protein BpHYR1_021774 [Brachionus plicatilis]